MLKALLWFACLLWSGCASAVRTDLAGLAEQPPLDYSVLVTGGAFVAPAGSVGGGLDARRTFPEDGIEAVELDAISGALEQARVFARIELDRSIDDAARRAVAGNVGDLPVGGDGMGPLLQRARSAGHDYVLVVQRLQDGPVEEYGINDRWPLTIVLWLVVGLGALIPDHTFESSAALHVSLFDVHGGREAYRTAESAGPVELSLVGRTDGWGLVQSILVPPFWVSSDDERVDNQMRSVAERRLLFAIARQLKSAASRAQLAERARSTMALERRDGRLQIRIRARDPLSQIAFRVDGRSVELAATDSILASEQREGDSLAYVGDLPVLTGTYVQVLAQTVTGDVSSMTFALEATR